MGQSGLEEEKKISAGLSKNCLSEKILAVVNPVSADGKTGRVWPDLADYFFDKEIPIIPVRTEYPQHSVNIVRKALELGYENIMSVGGDGTANEVVNGFFRDGRLINPKARLIIFSRGTGSDFIKSLGIDNSKREILKIIRDGRKKMVDIGEVSYRRYNGNKAQRYFINISDAGIGGATVLRVNNSSKYFGGILTYLFGIFKTLFLYNNRNFRLRIDGKKVLDRKVNSIIVANGSYFAGGMKIAPEAVIDNGLFNIVVLGDLTKVEIILNLYKAYSGSHLGHPKIAKYQGKDIFIETDQETFLNIDGESAGKLPARFRIFPAKLPVLII